MKRIRIQEGMAAVLAGATLLVAPYAHAEVKPNGLIGDGAVFQQGRKIPIWGTAGEGEKVTVSLLDQQATTTAKDGQWIVWLKPMKAGGPYSMTIQGDNKIELNNLLIGEVYVCSGQSNM